MKHVALVAVLGVLAGCGRKKPEEGLEPPPAMPQPGSAGSAEAPKPVTGEALATRYDACWDFFNKEKKDDINCLTTDAVAESPGGGPAVSGAAAVVDATKPVVAAFPDFTGTPQLELVHGKQIAAVIFVSGTQKGPLAGPTGTIAPTNKKIGFLLGQVATFEDTRIKHYAEYYDLATLLGQLQPAKDNPVRPALDKAPMVKEVVIAKDDAAEKANVEVAKRAIDAFGKHDAKAFGELLADDSTWSEQQHPTDWNKKQTLEDSQASWKAFSDLKMVPTEMWGAGDYVVVVATMDGTNDGAMPAAGIKQPTKKKVSLPFLMIQKLAGGKIKTTWVFAQGLAAEQQLGLAPTPAPAKP